MCIVVFDKVKYETRKVNTILVVTFRYFSKFIYNHVYDFG